MGCLGRGAMGEWGAWGRGAIGEWGAWEGGLWVSGVLGKGGYG